ncbi:hypothetical protein OC842_005245 [Tilletia horrida]|uniref:G-patch domain-containing protein n=1 Tax=Tilletia horrida TaxID=155126 RepID=A0AAN6JPI9_9BASI|nr:hypothetical protein OC842_005245 [Tilletia horrida]
MEQDDDEYAAWTAAAGQQLPTEGPAAGLAMRKEQHWRGKRARSPDADDMDEDEDEHDDGDEDEDVLMDAQQERGPRRDYAARDSHGAAAYGTQRRDRDEVQVKVKDSGEAAAAAALSNANVGHQLLLKLGWAGTGAGLGLHAQGRADPLTLHYAKLGADTSGIGKLRSTSAALDDALAQSRLHELAAERMATESADARRAREDGVRRREEVRAEVRASLSAFRCDICDGKQYANAAQFAEHSNSGAKCDGRR